MILELAEKPCIIVGRCADRILAEAGIDTLSIYLHASVEDRLERAQKRLAGIDVKPEKFIEKCDSQRRTFYKQYTGCEISDANNYTFCFDVGKVDIPVCADIVINLLERSE